MSGLIGNMDLSQVKYSLQPQANTKLTASNKAFDLNEAKQAAEDFEAFFVTTTLESMFEGVETDGFFGGGSSEKIYRSMLFNEYGKLMAKSGTVGVSAQVMDTILAMQEAGSQEQIAE